MTANGTFPPQWKTPLTDLFGNIWTMQENAKCAGFEMNAMKCVEAYGVLQRDKCLDYFDDLKECMYNEKQIGRLQVLRLERHRQYYKGEREEHFIPTGKPDCSAL